MAFQSSDYESKIKQKWNALDSSCCKITEEEGQTAGGGRNVKSLMLLAAVKPQQRQKIKARGKTRKYAVSLRPPRINNQTGHHDGGADLKNLSMLCLFLKDISGTGG